MTIHMFSCCLCTSIDPVVPPPPPPTDQRRTSLIPVIEVRPPSEVISSERPTAADSDVHDAGNERGGIILAPSIPTGEGGGSTLLAPGSESVGESKRPSRSSSPRGQAQCLQAKPPALWQLRQDVERWEMETTEQRRRVLQAEIAVKALQRRCYGDDYLAGRHKAVENTISNVPDEMLERLYGEQAELMEMRLRLKVLAHATAEARKKLYDAEDAEIREGRHLLVGYNARI